MYVSLPAIAMNSHIKQPRQGLRGARQALLLLADLLAAAKPGTKL